MKKHVYKPGHLFRLPAGAPEGYDGDTRFRVVAVGKGKVKATPHAKQKDKPTFDAKVGDMIWCPPITRTAYKDRKKAAKAAAKEVVGDEINTDLTVFAGDEITQPETETAIVES